MIEFKLPDIGEGMHEGEIIKWFIQEGDFVKQDQPVVEVQTDKVNAELSAPSTGMITNIFFKEGDTVEVGATLFIIQPENESSPHKTESETAAAQEQVIEKSDVNKTVPQPAKRRALATPYVRQMAREMSIQLEEVVGTGPAGRITESDLREYMKTKQSLPSPVDIKNQERKPPVLRSDQNEEITDHQINLPSQKQLEERIPLKGIRKKIADHMVKSVSTIPHVTHVDEIEMDVLHELRKQLKDYAKDYKLTYLPFFIKAVVIALKEFKALNASLDDKSNEIILKNYYHIGIATNTKNGLIVPVVKNADKKTIYELASELSQLASLAREGNLTIDQINGSTFTISNVGPFGGLYATPIINYPEAAILALHKMEPRMVVRNGEGVIRLMMNMSLSFDHRLIDGVTAVQFTNRIKELLENPNLLFMELR